MKVHICILPAQSLNITVMEGEKINTERVLLKVVKTCFNDR
jgi:hypothetical protein